MCTCVWFDFKPFCRYVCPASGSFDNAVGLWDRAVAIALDGFYIDDILNSASTKKELIVFIDDLGRLLSSLGLLLTKYFGNSDGYWQRFHEINCPHCTVISSLAHCPFKKHLGLRIMQLRMTLLRWQNLKKDP